MLTVTCPRCGHDEVRPVPGFDARQAWRRVVPALVALGGVMLWALAYLTVPVVTTIRGGSVNWVMTALVGLMWPLAALVMAVVWRVATERAMSEAYQCQRCGVRWPRRESQIV